MVEQKPSILTLSGHQVTEPATAAEHAAGVAGVDFDVLDARLERLNRLASMGAVTGMIAHEFNNILTPILSYAQMALEAPADRDLSKKALERTLAGAERAAKIAEAILNFVREEPLGTQASHCELALVVQDSLACLARRTVDAGGRVSVDIPAGLGAAIDGVRLQQVLVNLILNARAAMGEREGEMRISARMCERPPETPTGAIDSRGGSTWNETSRSSGTDAGWVVLLLQDFGPGMTAAQLGSLFTPFHTESDPRHHTGTGLGMTVSRRLVEGAGGWLVVESTRGAGTTVQIVLPRTGSTT